MSMQITETQQQQPAGLDNVKVPQIDFDSPSTVPPLNIEDKIPF